MTDTLREKALKASATMLAYEAWEPPAPPPREPIDYAGTADAITALLDEIDRLTALLDRCANVLDQPEVYSTWPVAALRMDIQALRSPSP